MVKIKRKVIQIANSTQLISLPKKWANKYNVKKGEELDIQEQGSKLIIGTDEKSSELSKVNVNVDGLDKDSLIFLLRGLFIRGYDQIIFTFNNPYIHHYRLNRKVSLSSIIHKEVGICQGLDIIQEKGNSIIIKNISVSSIKEFDTLFRRLFLLLIDLANDLYEATKESDYILLETFQDKHDTITRLINYNLKTLNNIGYYEHRNTIFLFSVLTSLDMVVDIFKNAAREIILSKMKLGKKGILIINKVQEAIKQHYELFYHYSMKNAENFVKKRQEILNSIRKQTKELSKDDIKIVVMLEQAIEILRDTYSSRIALEY